MPRRPPWRLDHDRIRIQSAFESGVTIHAATRERSYAALVDVAFRKENQNMKIMTVTLALGAALALSSAAQAQSHRHHRARVIVTPPAATLDPAWPVDYYVVPRYRYRPEDDRVDPYGKPIAPSYPWLGGIWYDE
jgi:nitric oxide reductase activation protein